VTCDRAPTFLGAYVLGSLEPAERVEAEQHLATCPVCAAELAEFRGLTAQLDRVPADEVDAEPVLPSPELFGRVAAEVGRPARRRWIAAGAAAAAVVIGGTTTWLLLRDDPEVFTAVDGEVWASVTAEEAASGTALDVTIGGLREGSDCAVVVVDAEGEEHPVASWTFPGGEKSWDVWSEVEPAEMAGISLLGSEGDQILWVGMAG
jgi:anti-sigma factor RsiW